MISFYKEVQTSCDKVPLTHKLRYLNCLSSLQAKAAFEAHIQSRSGALNNTIQKYYEERYRTFVEVLWSSRR
jgi:hypothetical protein